MPSTLSPASDRATGPDRLHVAFLVAFWLSVGTVAFSILGSILWKVALTWQIRPVVETFGPIYGALVTTPTWTYMALLPVLPALMYGPQVGWKRLGVLFLLGSCIGATSELAGTTTGFPFGAYHYTDMLGPKIAGHVPWFIPPSWFAMSIVSLDLAGRLLGFERAGRWRRVVLGAVFMTLWDVSLDPAMNAGEPLFWTYPGGGFYYGMPLTNWLGWLGVSLAIMAAYELAGGLKRSHPWTYRVYVLNCAFPLLLCTVYGMWWAVLFGALATAVPALLGAARAALPPPLPPGRPAALASSR